MSFIVSCYARFASILDGTPYQGGSIEKPTTLVVAGQKEDPTYTIANAANATVYSNSIGQFEFAFIESDMNTRVVLTDTESNVFSLGLRGTGVAGRYGVGLPLGQGTTLNSNTTINSIVVHNESGSSAQVRAFIVK